MFFNVDVVDAHVAEDSSSQIGAVRAAGGWGNGDRFRIDFGMTVLHATSSTPTRMFTPDEQFFLDPDCDMTEVPVPIPGNIEGETGYQCTTRGDCHLIVLDDDTGKLYEMWKANIKSSLQFEGGCVAIWDTRKSYGTTLRGDQCASADGAGFPIAPMLFDADEVAAGTIDHAIRFVLPNDRIRQGFVRPGRHRPRRRRHMPPTRAAPSARRTTASTSGSAPTIRSTRSRARARRSSRGRCRSTACITPTAASTP